MIDHIPTIPLFVTSLSEEGDLLSQWRAYCPATGGFAIGFDPLALMKSATMPLIQCVYGPSSQEALVGKGLDKILADFRAAHVAGAQPHAVPSRFGASFVTMALYLGAAFKHPSFHEEKEWRLVARANVVGATDLKFREGRGGVVPYFAFPLGATAEAVTEIVCGPTPHPHWARVAVEQAGVNSLKRSIPVRPSIVPYRTW